MAKEQVPAVDGWFTMDSAQPELIGQKGRESGTYFFPPSAAPAANPASPFEERDDVRLSRHGRAWSWTTGNYAPPEPYVAPDPFVPYTVVAVELEEEKMVVLGQLADGHSVDELSLGQPMELVLGPLYEDDDHTYMVWKWKPVAEAG